jgi:hypothetical protein
MIFRDPPASWLQEVILRATILKDMLEILVVSYPCSNDRQEFFEASSLIAVAVHLTNPRTVSKDVLKGWPIGILSS